jgi:glucose-1-phosphate thymidylyltransferase
MFVKGRFEEVKGIILAGGSGTRLYPMTRATSKQLLQVYDKPMIYYPMATLMSAGINDILLITTKEDQDGFKRLLGDGSNFGIHLEYIIQPSPDGLAQAFILGKNFIGDDNVAMVLGDNIFYGAGLNDKLKESRVNAENDMATIFGYEVKDPERFGIMEFDKNNNVIGVEEKPTSPKSDYAITGLYFYPKGVSEKAKDVQKSARGEYEITDLNRIYLENGNLKAQLLGDGYTWYDTGTPDSMNDAANMIKSIEDQGNRIICCPEKIAYDNGWIDDEKLEEAANLMKKNKYGKYLQKVLRLHK